MLFYPTWMDSFERITTDNDVIIYFKKEFNANNIEALMKYALERLWCELYYGGFIISGSNRNEFYFNVNNINYSNNSIQNMLKNLYDNKESIIFFKYNLMDKITYEINLTDELYAESLLYLL